MIKYPAPQAALGGLDETKYFTGATKARTARTAASAPALRVSSIEMGTIYSVGPSGLLGSAECLGVLHFGTTVLGAVLVLKDDLRSSTAENENAAEVERVYHIPLQQFRAFEGTAPEAEAIQSADADIKQRYINDPLSGFALGPTSSSSSANRPERPVLLFLGLLPSIAFIRK